MSRIVVSPEWCKGCELCVSVCPKDCLEHSDALNRYGVYPIRMRAGAECIGCSQCAVMCPDAAIEVYRTAKESNATRHGDCPDLRGAASDNEIVPFAGREPAKHEEALA